MITRKALAKNPLFHESQKGTDSSRHTFHEGNLKTGCAAQNDTSGWLPISLWRKRAIVSLLAALVVVLAACDSTGTTPSTPAPTATPISATPATGTIAAVSVPPLDTPSGKVAATSITIGVANDPVRLDPAIVGDETSLMVSRQIYDTLYEYEAGSVQVNPSIIKFRAKDDFGKNGQQVIYSGVCRDANNDITKEGSDGKCFQLQLLPELRFSNGDPLDARAVALNFRRWRCLASPNLGSLAQAIASVDITQPSINQTPGQKIVVHLSQPRTTFDSDLARPQYAIINPAVWVEPGFAVSADVLKNPDTFAPLCPKDMLPPFGTTADSLDGAGSGPYMVKEWKAHDKLRLETNPIYLTADAQKNGCGAGGQSLQRPADLQRPSAIYQHDHRQNVESQPDRR